MANKKICISFYNLLCNFQIASGEVSFQIDGTAIYLFGIASDVGVTGTSTETNVGDLIDSLSSDQCFKKKKYSLNKIVSVIKMFLNNFVINQIMINYYFSFKEIVPVSLVMKATKDILSDKLVKTAVKMMTTQRKRKLHIIDYKPPLSKSCIVIMLFY